ncbi:hypothetical protein [Thalassomonas sp. RHCl1]|uniref:hypothetical protein n=1 Tax=Thalassomonas sp. RHCl1 TaxID=2995320 RepID=UPI00248D2FAE|nr:hypothetical protein [Thalassomonas sp. RHCl1]
MVNLNEIIELSKLPKSVAVKKSYELVIAASIIGEDYEPIPKYLLDNLLTSFRDKKIMISDISIESGEVEVFDKKETLFYEECTADYINETGLQSFLVEFLDSNTFLVGVDLDFVLIVSPKENGFISDTGGTEFYMTKAANLFDSKTSGLSKDTFATLFDAVKAPLPKSRKKAERI